MRRMTTPGTALEKRLMTWRTVWMVVGGCFAVLVHVALRWREWGLSQPSRAGQPTLPERPDPDSLK